jgi:cell division protein FtsQ
MGSRSKRRSVLKAQSVKKKKKRDPYALFKVIPQVGSGVLKMILLVSAVGIVSLSFIFTYHYLLTSPHMKLRQVEMKGVDGKLRSELIRMCGLNPKMSLLELKLGVLKKEMESHPWIRSVKIERKYPHTLTVFAERQNPAALVVAGGMQYMNSHGEIFKEVLEWEDVDMPVITGVLPSDSDRSRQLRAAVCVIEVLGSEKGMWSLRELSEIHVEDDGGMSLYFGHLAARIRLTEDDLANKVKGLKKVAEHLTRTGKIRQVTGIDLNHLDGALVSFKEG